MLAGGCIGKAILKNGINVKMGIAIASGRSLYFQPLVEIFSKKTEPKASRIGYRPIA